MVQMHEIISKELKQISTNSVTDLTPAKNQDFAFKIEFIDPNQKAIKCKCRPLPYHLKEKVRLELEKQFGAGLFEEVVVHGVLLFVMIIRLISLYNKLTESDTFTVMYMKTAYFQITVEEALIEVTSFIYEFGRELDGENATEEHLNKVSKSLIDDQLEDEDIQWLINIKNSNNEKPKTNIFENIIRKILYKEYDNLIVKDGTLSRYSDDHNGNLITQFVFPKNSVQKIGDHIHSSIFNAHLGYSKTSSKISERFYRPFLKDDIKNCIKLCDVCQKVKANQQEHKAELLYLTPCRPNQLITTDLAGP
ncbi:unnamed protein product [Brachionus calyciflorus]|uniref:Integrase zinc-binding domain-containing protein n=1 Tax=Brachionus calyciflorus TaxID=104777 RepID=A0A814GAU2_9BILA|nr:unnamed protein product [Brachionus calyciflorus]